MDPMSIARGSSPLTRGKLGVPLRTGALPGLIPAHAGKTMAPPGASAGSWAHPRSRGENAGRRLQPEEAQGSSPLTRGKHLGQLRWQPVRGLIPAHAGKTRGRPARTDGPGAHPRSRGENRRLDGAPFDLVGSSPLTRGKRSRPRRLDDERGLIPAHAGKTATTPAARQHPRAHPRSRGENRS